MPPELPDHDLPWEALEDLAAGALPEAEAAALRARIARDPHLARAYARAETVERALAAEGLFASPRALALRITEQAQDALAPRPGWLGTAWRAAAAVALAVGAWSAWVGGAPTLSAPATPAWARPPLTLPGEAVLAAAPDVPAGAAPWVALGALALVAGGLALARRWGTGPASGGRSA